MTLKRPAAALLVVLFALPITAFGQSKPLEMKWGELAPLVTGPPVTVTLSDGTAVKGEAIAVRDDAMLLDVSSASKGYPKGSGSVPRNSIALIDLQRAKGSWGRTLGTVIGVLGGMSLGVYVDAKNSSSISTAGATGTFVGIAGAGAVAGYFAGRGIDKRITHIKIVP